MLLKSHEIIRLRSLVVYTLLKTPTPL